MVNESGCWIWVRAKRRHGYGSITLHNKAKIATRVSYEAFVGSAKGKWVLHTCDVPACVNPEHLYLGGPAENGADMAARNRSMKGEKNNKAKLEAKDVKKIRELHAAGLKQVLIAGAYGITQNMVSKIVLRRNWQHV